MKAFSSQNRNKMPWPTQVLVFCVGAALGASLIFWDVAQPWVLGAGFGGIAVAGLVLARTKAHDDPTHQMVNGQVGFVRAYSNLTTEMALSPVRPVLFLLWLVLILLWPVRILFRSVKIALWVKTFRQRRRFSRMLLASYRRFRTEDPFGVIFESNSVFEIHYDQQMSQASVVTESVPGGRRVRVNSSAVENLFEVIANIAETASMTHEAEPFRQDDLTGKVVREHLLEHLVASSGQPEFHSLLHARLRLKMKDRKFRARRTSLQAVRDRMLKTGSSLAQYGEMFARILLIELQVIEDAEDD